MRDNWPRGYVEGAAPVRMSSAEFGEFVEAEIAKWGPVVKKAGMKAE